MKEFTEEWYIEEFKCYLSLCMPSDHNQETIGTIVAMFAGFLCGKFEVSGEELGVNGFGDVVNNNMSQLIKMVEEAV